MHDWEGPFDQEAKYYDIIKRDDVPAFEEYLHNAYCFTHNRMIPFVYAKEYRDNEAPWTGGGGAGIVRSPCRANGTASSCTERLSRDKSRWSGSC